MSRSSRCHRLPLHNALHNVIESLECRRLLAAATLDGNGILTITGTSRADVISVFESGKNLIVAQNGSTSNFTRRFVARIEATLGSGNDSLKLASTLKVPTNVAGGAGDDTIVGGADADTLFGEAGADLLQGNGGNDTLDGGSGIDEVTYAERSASIDAVVRLAYGADDPNVSNVQIAAFVSISRERDSLAAFEVLDGGRGIDTMTFNPDIDPGQPPPTVALRMNGGENGDVLRAVGAQGFAGQALVTLDGGDGDDRLEYANVSSPTLIGGAGGDVFENLGTGDVPAAIDAGAGTDTFIYGNAAGMTYTMPAGLEQLTATGQTLDITGSNGNNAIVAYGQTATLRGGGGDDQLEAITTGNSLLAGDSGNDTLTGGIGADTLAGGSGDDRLAGGAGDDSLNGGADADTLDGGAGDDAIDGGSGGSDVVSYAARITPVTAQLTASVNGIAGLGGEGAERDTFAGVETLWGGAGNDHLTAGGTGTFGGTIDGRAGDDLIVAAGPLSAAAGVTLIGGAGDDAITGAAGRDSLDGGTGDDTISGGAGIDTIRGGAGNDMIAGNNDSDHLFGDAGNDTINGDAGNDQLDGGAGIDSLDGGDGVDRAIKDKKDRVVREIEQLT